MNKKDIKYYSVLAAIFIAVIIFEIMKPKPIDWRFTLDPNDKMPYGTYVFNKTIKDIFPNKKIYSNTQTIYEFNKSINTTEKKNYIFISKDFKIDKIETNTILDLANSGNDILISSHSFSKQFADTLGFEVNNLNFFDTISNINFYNKKIKRNRAYFFGKMAAKVSFKKIDTINSQALSHSGLGKITFIKKKFGNGNIYINLTPEMFTNYGMVTEKNYDLVYTSLSYLPNKDVVIDRYYKPFRRQEKGYFSVIFKFPALKTAFFLLIISVLLFVVFVSKRKQRIIPIINPFENKTLDFIETISRVYFNSKNHKDIAQKKYQYLSNFLLSQYNVNIASTQAINYDAVAEKLAVDVVDVKKLLLYYDKINKLEKISQEQLNKFNNYIEDFYDNCK